MKDPEAQKDPENQTASLNLIPGANLAAASLPGAPSLSAHPDSSPSPAAKRGGQLNFSLVLQLAARRGEARGGQVQANLGWALI